MVASFLNAWKVTFAPDPPVTQDAMLIQIREDEAYHVTKMFTNPKDIDLVGVYFPFKSHRDDDESIRRLRREPPPPAIWHHEWNPSESAGQIIADINLYISDVFRDVPFPELVRAACGHPSNFITSLLGWVSTTRSKLSSLLEGNSILRSEFKPVEQASPSMVLTVFYPD
jgi:hypothetical protein